LVGNIVRAAILVTGFATATLFALTDPASDGRGLAGTDAEARMDLLTTVTHELGHVPDLPDQTSGTSDLPDGLVSVGERRAPSADDGFFSDLLGASGRLPVLLFENR